MTNTGFVALPILQATYGSRGGAAGGHCDRFCRGRHVSRRGGHAGARSQASQRSRFAPAISARHVILNPMVLSTLIGVAWAASGAPMPGIVSGYLHILADALTACALFAIGLGVSIEGLRANSAVRPRSRSSSSSLMPFIVLGLAIALRLDPLYLIAAVICAAVPTAKTVYILAGEYHCEESLVAATVSMTTLCSIGTLIVWIYALAKFFPLEGVS